VEKKFGEREGEETQRLVGKTRTRIGTEQRLPGSIMASGEELETHYGYRSIHSTLLCCFLPPPAGASEERLKNTPSILEYVLIYHTIRPYFLVLAQVSFR
jgi:hypothetical protein